MTSDEVQAEGMQCQAVQRVAPVAILAVAGYGEAKVGHVHADLVLAPRFQFHLHQRKVVVALP